MYYLKRLKGFLINYFSTQKKSIITTTPIFLTIDRSNNTEAVCENIKRYFSEMSIRVKKQITEENIAIYIQEHNKTIIEKAKKWKIPFVEDNINFFALADEVDNYEYLLAKAKDEYNIQIRNNMILPMEILVLLILNHLKMEMYFQKLNYLINMIAYLELVIDYTLILNIN